MRIGHYATDIWAPGGVSSYVRRVGRAQAARGDTVLYAGQVPSADSIPPDLTPHYVSTETDLFCWAGRCRLGVPIFLILPGSGSGRSVRLGRVVGWDDPSQRFLILYGANEETLLDRLAERRGPGGETGLGAGLRAGWTEIDHLKRPGQSSFYAPCRSALQEVGNDLQLMGPLEVTFEAEKDGYPGDERVQIGGPGEKAFQTDWARGADKSKEPSPVASSQEKDL